MYGLAWLLWQRWHLFGGRPAGWALPIAVAVEAGWQVIENTPAMMARYRAVTVSWGYSGDSIVNSASDIGWMMLSFLFASRVPAWLSLCVGVSLELLTLAFIRDKGGGFTKEGGPPFGVRP